MDFLENLNLVLADKYYGRDHVIRKNREKVRQSMKMRRELNRMAMPESLPNGMSRITMRKSVVWEISPRVRKRLMTHINKNGNFSACEKYL